ncbi:hypothetical protein MESS2_320037 [Mesorhizobium metallidurans STM 2683]|uniref:Uncharacterized protein n=1 Tax=Mesorhizobium metallidurans STM 2683 TaxID=1297569 RepID=M5F3S3_9HYPH|nr:hypothetical protein MESS2_320037 [Mesorhizobium metallidurans STM 2683]
MSHLSASRREDTETFSRRKNEKINQGRPVLGTKAGQFQGLKTRVPLTLKMRSQRYLSLQGKFLKWPAHD